MDNKLRVTVEGSIINIILSVSKILFGILGRSYGLIADGLHSFSDLVTDIIVIFGILIGRKPPDLDHHYGHKKIENFAEVLLSLALVGVSIKIAYDSFTSLYLKESVSPAFYTIPIAAVSVIAKEYIYQVTKKIAVETRSDSLLANAWHHRSDALTSVAIVISLILGIYLPGLGFLDALMGILISVLIMYIGVKIGIKSLKKLSDVAPPAEYIDKVKSVIVSAEGIEHVHQLRMRYVGDLIYVECHIEVDPEISVKAGHDIASELKKKVMAWDSRIFEFMVHIEPRGDHLINRDQELKLD